MVGNMLRKCKSFFKKAEEGAILIEFAFAIPVLVAILYFIMDGPLLRLYQLKLKNTAYFAINMMQNITDTRENKAITLNDLRNIRACAFANIYRSTAQFKNDKGNYPLGHYGHIYLYYLKGTGTNQASVKWIWDSGAPGPKPSQPENEHILTTIEKQVNSIVDPTRTKAGEIYKDLQINNGEIKLIVEVSILVPGQSDTGAADIATLNGKDGATLISSSEAVRQSGAGKLGFYILPVRNMNGTLNSYLNYVAIFTPKPGIFSDSVPVVQ